MASPTLPFLDFLKQSAAQFRTTTTPLHLVIGNEAGDADSIVSALTYAYVASTTASSQNNDDDKADCSSEKENHWRIPIVSIPREDLLTQRPETILLLERAGLTRTDIQEHIIFVDDLPQFEATQRQEVTLVDHNALSDSVAMAILGDDEDKKNALQVVEIWDHHLDLQQHQATCPPNRRHIAFDNGQALVASTCTLVAEQWLKETSSPSSFSSSVAYLLLGTIVLDSVNMSPQAGKGTERDAHSMRALMALDCWNDATPNAQELFQALQNAKFDVQFWNALSVRNALRLDYKAFGVTSSLSLGKEMSIGISTVLLPWSDFGKKSDLGPSLEQYMVEFNNLPILTVMMTSTTSKGQFQRELLLCALDDDDHGQQQENRLLLDSVVKLLLQSSSTENTIDLQLLEQKIEMQNSSALHVRLFRQGNAKASRKQVAPILMRHLATLF